MLMLMIKPLGLVTSTQFVTLQGAIEVVSILCNLCHEKFEHQDKLRWNFCTPGRFDDGRTENEDGVGLS